MQERYTPNDYYQRANQVNNRNLNSLTSELAQDALKTYHNLTPGTSSRLVPLDNNLHVKDTFFGFDVSNMVGTVVVSVVAGIISGYILKKFVK